MSLVFCLLIYTTTVGAVAKIKVLQPAEHALALDHSRRGYLLISLSSIEAAASFEFSMLRQRGDGYAEAGILPRRRDTSYRVSIQGLSAGFYLMELPQGWYQITHVHAPYFNLPFRLDVESQPSWRFHIKGNQVNYVGQLFISKERSTNYVEIRLKNRIASQYFDIQQTMAPLLSQMPLGYGGGVRDDFLMNYQGTSP